MKKIHFLIVLVFCCAFPLFARGKKEVASASFAGYIRYSEVFKDVDVVADNAVVPLLSPVQKNHLATSHDERIAAFADKEKRTVLKVTGSVPQSVVIGCHCNYQTAHQHVFEIAENADFKESVTFSVTASTVCIGNLKTGITYYWKVTCKDQESAGKVVPIHAFTTEDISPRMIAIDGVQNVRDCGGWKTNDGKRIRQSMIFRSAAFNANTRAVYKEKKDLLAENPDMKTLEERHLDAIRLATSSMDDTVTFLSSESLSIEKKSIEWSMFRLQKGRCDGVDMENFMKLSTIPTEFCSVQAEILVANVRKKTAVIPNGENFETALLMTPVYSSATGMVQVTFESSVPCAIAVNGNVILNSLGVKAKSSLTMAMPVKTGENLIAVAVSKRGMPDPNASMAFTVRLSHKKMDYKTMCENRIKYEKNILKSMFSRVFDKWQMGKVLISPAMQDYLTKGLNIKTDMDLRSEKECHGMTSSPIGKETAWLRVEGCDYDEINKPESKKNICTIFRTLVEKDNYPLILHGTDGRDETGVIVFLLNGVLGVPEEQLLLDWEASAFCSSAITFQHAKKISKLIEALNTYKGETVNERIESYLLSCGITQDEIKTLQNLLKE